MILLGGYQLPQFRIIPDPNDKRKWAYEVVDGSRSIRISGGYPTANEARRAYNRLIAAKKSK